MKVNDYKFSDNEINKLKAYRDKQNDGRLKIRFIALILLAEGILPLQIASVIGKSTKTIERWVEKYHSHGIESLNSFQYKSKKEYITKDQVNELIQWVKENSPTNTQAIRD